MKEGSLAKAKPKKAIKKNKSKPNPEWEEWKKVLIQVATEAAKAAVMAALPILVAKLNSKAKKGSEEAQ